MGMSCISILFLLSRNRIRSSGPSKSYSGSLPLVCTTLSSLKIRSSNGFAPQKPTMRQNRSNTQRMAASSALLPMPTEMMITSSTIPNCS